MSMNGQRRRPKSALGARALTFAGVSAFLPACSTSAPPPPPAAVDCSVEDAYDIRSVENYDPGGNSYQASWFAYGDLTPGSVQTQGISAANTHLPTMPIEAGGLCGAQNALVLVSAGHNDYGSGFGSYCLGGNYAMLDPNTYVYPCTAQDATGYEGFSFWARNPPLPLGHVPGQVISRVILDSGIPEAGAPDGDIITDSGYYDAPILTYGTDQGPFKPTYTTKGVTVAFDDRHSSTLASTFNTVVEEAGVGSEISGPCLQAPPSMGTCITTVDPNTGSTTTGGSGCVPLPNQCGNSFTRTLALTDQWQLYLLPFTSFKQDILPNRTIEDIDLSTIFTFGFRIPKEAVTEIWITKLGFYRKKQ
jgi:hypothetical protein